MECDWEIEIAPEAPVIDGSWEGFVNLRSDPSRVYEITEAVQFPALAEALVRLNSSSSPVWTAKCDVWAEETVDPDEMEADEDSATSALACYMDILPARAQAGRPPSTLDDIADWCRRLCIDLRSRPLRQSRVDAVVRRAFFHPAEAGLEGGPDYKQEDEPKHAIAEGLGITAYITACGPSQPQASAVFSSALTVFADSVLAVGTSPAAAIEVQ